MIVLRQPIPRGVHIFCSKDPKEVVERIAYAKDARIYDLPDDPTYRQNKESLERELDRLDQAGEFISVWETLSLSQKEAVA